MAIQQSSCHELLCLVSGGNALIAEVLRLKDVIPDVYKLDTKANIDMYGDIIKDFSYFSSLPAEKELAPLDIVLKQANMVFLSRIYSTFHGIHNYVVELKNLTDEFVQDEFGSKCIPSSTTTNSQCALEVMFLHEECRQLLCEALFLFGAMLLIVDIYIPGPVRERLLVAFYRYGSKEEHQEGNFDDICKLLSSTGLSHTTISNGYPENYFRRATLDKKFLDMVVQSLISTDIYNQVPIYPLPDHRAVALANQGGMLAVCLFFTPNILRNNPIQMRKIVDKFYPDNWIIPFYMGITINLLELWSDSYKAARDALNNTTNRTLIKENCAIYNKQLQSLIINTNTFLQDGILTDMYLVKNTRQLMTLFRECNVCLRWLILQRGQAMIECSNNKLCTSARNIVKETTTEIDILSLLLNTSGLELRVREALEHIIGERDARWIELKAECMKLCSELALAFGGEKLVLGIEIRDDLKKWFTDFVAEVEKLDISTESESLRKVGMLERALDKIREFSNIDSNVQICLYLSKASDVLQQMAHIITIKEDILIKMQAIGDFSYAWLLGDMYRSVLQNQIEKNSNIPIKLRTLFLKMATSLEIPLLRINQLGSPDLYSVSQYYSSELIKFVKRIIQVVPQQIFHILMQIVQLQGEFRTIPIRVEKCKLKDYIQTEKRFKLAQLTHKLSVLAEGVLMMKKTLVGVIEMDPKCLLEEGMSLELKQQLEAIFESFLILPESSINRESLSENLVHLKSQIQNFHISFQYVQEYLNIFALRLYHKELSSIVQANVERECSLMRTMSLKFSTERQRSKRIRFTSNTFIGRLCKEVAKATDPITTLYVATEQAWFDRKQPTMRFDSRQFKEISEAIAPSVLMGMDMIYGIAIADTIEIVSSMLERHILMNSQWESIVGEAQSLSMDLNDRVRFYLGENNQFVTDIESEVTAIGHLQLLRGHFAFNLNNNAMANSLEPCINTFIESYLASGFDGNMERSSEQCAIISALCSDSEAVGVGEPIKKIYSNLYNSTTYALVWSNLILILASKLVLFNKLEPHCDMRKLGSKTDAFPFILGIYTILRHNDGAVMDTFMDNCSVIIRSFISTKQSNKVTVDVVHYVSIIETLLSLGKISPPSFVEEAPIYSVINSIKAK